MAAGELLVVMILCVYVQVSFHTTHHSWVKIVSLASITNLGNTSGYTQRLLHMYLHVYYYWHRSVLLVEHDLTHGTRGRSPHLLPVRVTQREQVAKVSD